MVITLIGENDAGNTPATADLLGWAEEYASDFPIVADANFTYTSKFIAGSSIGLPSMQLLGPNAEVISADSRVTRQQIEAVLPR
jgi:hypothetical protein